MQYVFAEQMPYILNSLDIKNRKQIIQNYTNLLNNDEIEVSITALSKLKEIAHLVE